MKSCSGWSGFDLGLGIKQKQFMEMFEFLAFYHKITDYNTVFCPNLFEDRGYKNVFNPIKLQKAIIFKPFAKPISFT